ncbi:MAG: SufE family protein [Croceimicrobium sp.]
MPDLKEIQEEIIAEFQMFDDWMQRYEYLIDLGKSLPLIAEEHKLDENIIKGCQSRVWLHAEGEKAVVHFRADSDAILTKGLIALLIRVFDGQPAEAISGANLYFLDEIGLKEHLSPTRANGLLSMVKQMKFYALALQAN